MYLNIVKARLLQIRFQLCVFVDGHAADDFRPLLVPVRVAVALVADENGSAALQHPSDLAKALRQIRPEVDGFKSRDQIELLRFKRQLRHARAISTPSSFSTRPISRRAFSGCGTMCRAFDTITASKDPSA